MWPFLRSRKSGMRNVSSSRMSETTGSFPRLNQGAESKDQRGFVPVQGIEQALQPGKGFGPSHLSLEELQVLLFKLDNMASQHSEARLALIVGVRDLLFQRSGLVGDDLNVKLLETIKRFATSVVGRSLIGEDIAKDEIDIFLSIDVVLQGVEMKLQELSDKAKRSEDQAASPLEPNSNVFLHDKAMYNAEVILKLVRGKEHVVQPYRKNPTTNFAELVTKLAEVALGNRESIAWLIGRGIKQTMQTASSVKGSLPLQLLLVEQFTSLILKHDSGITVANAMNWMRDMSNLFAERFAAGLRFNKDWLVIYGLIDCTLNLALRFPQVQESAVGQFAAHREYKTKPLKSATAFWGKFRDASEYKRRLGFKFLEALAQLVHWGEQSVQTRAQAALDEHRRHLLSQSADRYHHMLNGILQVPPTRYSELLSFPSVADFLSVETCCLAVRTLFSAPCIPAAEQARRVLQQATQRPDGQPITSEYLESIVLPHLPQPVLQTLACSRALLCGADLGTLRRVFVQILVIPLFSPGPTISAPQNLVAQTENASKRPDSGFQVQSADVLQEDLAATAGTELGDLHQAPSSQDQGQPSGQETLLQRTVTEDDVAEVQESARVIQQHIKAGAAPEGTASGRHVVVVGGTGSGKSTTVCSLAGCDLRTLTDEEAKQYGASTAALTVRPVCEGGAKDAVTAVGNSALTSQTELLRSFAIAGDGEGGGFLAWDAPGFEDSHGPEINIANAVNLARLFQSSQREGLVILVVLDTPSLEAGKASVVKDTMRILTHMFGEDSRLEGPVLSSMLFCVTKASASFFAETLRELVVAAAAKEGLSVSSEQIVVFDPLSRHKEGIGPTQLRQKLANMPVFCQQDRACQAPLSATDKLLIDRISRVLCGDATSCLHRGDFHQIQAHLSMFRSLQVIANQLVTYHYNVVVGCIWEAVRKWFLSLLATARSFAPQDRAAKTYLLDMLQKAQELDQSLPDGYSVQSLYSEAYKTVQVAEKEMQSREEQLVNTNFTNAKANLRSALKEHSESLPEIFSGFNVDWTTDECLHSYGNISQVQVMQQVRSQARETLARRAPGQIYVFGDQGDLIPLLELHDRQIRVVFKDAWHKSRATLLEQAFTKAFAILQHEMEATLRAANDEDISFLTCRVVPVEEVNLLADTAGCASATELHDILEGLRSEHPEEFQRSERELVTWLVDVHQRTVDFRVGKLAVEVKEQQDAFVTSVEGDIEQWAPRIQTEGVSLLRSELYKLHASHGSLWAEIETHADLASVATTKRDLESREMRLLDSLKLAADNALEQRAAATRQAEMEVRGRMEQLHNQSFEVVKREHVRLSSTLVSLDGLRVCGFESTLINDVIALRKGLPSFDAALADSFAKNVDSFLAKLQQRAIAEKAAAALRTSYAAFEQTLRGDLQRRAESIVQGREDLHDELLRTISNYHVLWETLTSRADLPGVQDTVNGTKRAESESIKRMQIEADQFLKQLVSDRKQRDAAFDALLVDLKQESQGVIRADPRKVAATALSGRDISQVAHLGFNAARVSELSALMSILEHHDPTIHQQRVTQLDQFLTDMQETAAAVAEAFAFRKAMHGFQANVRANMYSQAQILHDGGRQKLEHELQCQAPDEVAWWVRLCEGHLLGNSLVKAVMAEVAGEKDSLLSQMQRDVENHLANLVSDRKQVQQKLSAHLIRLQESTAVIEANCEALSGCAVSPEAIGTLRMFGFEKQALDEIAGLLKHIREHDKEKYSERLSDLEQALQNIRKAAAERWVEKLRAKTLLLLGQGKDRLLARVDGMVNAMVRGHVDVRQELVTPAMAACMSAIEECPTERSETVRKEVDAEVERIADDIGRFARERADMRAREEKSNAREALSNKIMQLLPELCKHQEPDQALLREALDDLLQLDGESDQYKQVIAAVSKELQRMISQVEIQRLVDSKDFNGLNGRAQTMRRLEQLLQRHIKLSSEEVVTAVQRQMQELVKEVEVELEADISSDAYLEFTKLRNFMSILDLLKRSFQGLGEKYDLDPIKLHMQQKAGEHISRMLENVQAKVTESEELSLDVQKTVAKLLIKGYGTAHELRFDEDFRHLLEKQLISRCSATTKSEIGRALREYRNSHPSDKVKEMASIIINTFPAFAAWQIEQFRDVAGGVTFTTALQQLRCDPPSCNDSALSTAYAGYYKVYEELVNHIVKDNQAFPAAKTKARVAQLAQELKLHATTLGSKVAEFGELLGLVCGLWSSLSCDANSRRERRSVKQPQATQILGILRLLGLDRAELCNHLIQIDTGEGKSIALGFTATILALLGFRVDVVCYSRYLSERDHKAFLHLFTSLSLERQISYSDFEQLSNRIMKDGSHDFPDMRRVYLSFLEGKKYSHSQSQRGPSVLLMDEVDIFFSDCFYGRAYNPCAELDDDACFSLINFVWEHRSELRDCDAHVAAILQRPETTALQRAFPMLSHALLQVEYRKLLQAVRLFDVTGTPKLTGMHPYAVDRREQRIGYVDPVSGVPNFEWSYGYVTAFTYLYCASQNMLRLDDIRHRIRIQPVCGSLLYSCIPTMYNFCLGMTGTLDCLSEAQHSLLQKFGLRVQTFLPTTFQRQRLNANEDPNKVQTVVETGTWNEYFEVVKADIEEKLDAGRASLVVFEDQRKLERFSLELQRCPPTLTQYRPAKELTDMLNSSDRDHMVIDAVQKFAITLMTRPYGRGTDFVCSDNGLVKNGGVHVIVTFFPGDDSENKQINGRTCRQNNPGSARKILFEEDLQWLSATETDKERTGLDWDQYLAQCRATKEVERFEAMEASETKIAEIHRETLAAASAVQSGRWDAACAFFTKFAQASSVSQSTRSSYHLVLVLDQSGSMMGQKWADLMGAVNALVSKRQSFGTQDLISIVIFSNSAEIGCEQVDVNQSPQTCLVQSHWYGGTSFAAGLGKALEVLRRGCDAGLPQSLLFMSDGESDDGDQEMQAIHHEFQRTDLVINTLAFGSDARSDKLEQLALLGGGTLLTAVDGAALKEEFSQVAFRLGHLDR